jgi:hypothetical protein
MYNKIKNEVISRRNIEDIIDREMAYIDKTNEKQAKIQAQTLDDIFSDFKKILSESFEEFVKGKKGVQSLEGGDFIEQLKIVLGNVMEKVKRFANSRMKKCAAYKAFEQKHSNTYIVKNLPRELTKKLLINVKAGNKEELGPQNNSNRLNSEWLVKTFYEVDLGYYDELKKAVIEKLKDIREYDLEMIYEASRDFLTKDLDPTNIKEIEEYIEYSMKIETAVINEVLEYLGTEARKGIEQEEPKLERPNMQQIEEEEKQAD